MARTDRRHFERLLEDLRAAPARWRTANLALFAGRAGAAQRGDLMVIGRALNGGDVQFNISELRDALRLERLIDSAYAEAAPDDGDPMGWVAGRWGSAKGYNTRRSQFWRVIRGVALEVVPGASDNDWHSTVVWTNLYKVSPGSTGNPPASLIRLQRNTCVDILADELEHWQPRRVLFLTGLAWAHPFLQHLGWPYAVCGYRSPIEAVGRSPHGVRFVVAPHPQTRAEGPLVDEACRYLGTAGRR
ncbi:hypothetical protein WMF37_05865 [Sorangium sp. So ce291]|uniref:hypothetical protein n=1 Tax=Sorangium sp. So ce291 TaxID=3133294 RepID=UPI003F61BF60